MSATLSHKLDHKTQTIMFKLLRASNKLLKPLNILFFNFFFQFKNNLSNVIIIIIIIIHYLKFRISKSCNFLNKKIVYQR